jgi:O-antigen ligase
VIFLIAGVSVSSVASRVTDIFSQNSTQVNSFTWRTQVWRDSMPWIMRKPFFGHGLGSFHTLSPNFLVFNKRGAEAHNVYIQLLFEAGLAGFVTYVAIFWNLVREFYWRLKRSSKELSAEYAIALSYIFIYFLSATADNLLSYLTLNWYVWFFIGVLLKATKFQRLIPRSGVREA